MGELEVIADGRRFVFPPTATVRIGRAPEADVVIPLATVGRLHGHVTFDEGQWTFYDDASRNGTWIGDDRVDRVPIAGPTTLRLGGREGGGDLMLRPAPEPAGPRDGGNGDAASSSGPTPSPLPAGDRPAAGPPAVGMPAGGAAAVGIPAGGAPPVAEPGAGPPPVGVPAVGMPAGGPPGPPPGGAALSPGPPPGGAAPSPAGIPRVPGGPIMPPAMGGRGPAGGTLMAHSQAGTPVLVARLGTKQFLFPVGASIRIGREPGLEMVSDNPLVSRNYHALLTSDSGGATFTDSSSRGSFLDGKRITGPLRITESVTIRLGDPATGEELGVTPPLSAEEIEHYRRRRQASRRLKTALGIGALLVLVIAVVVVVVKVSNRGSTASSLTVARQATVLLLQGTPADAPGAGSGTIISPDGLILTNGHVAEPQAPGEAVSLGSPGQQLESNPPFLTVEVYAGESSPVVPKYRAKLVSVDGYLDLAVVKIYATASGAPIAASSLHLPYLHIGDVATLQLDQHVRVLGFPGVSQSNSLTITDGVISTFVPDPLGHVHDNRFELETTARVAHGNSGGAAIDDHGDLIGVPSLTIPGEGGDISWRLRSVAEAIPLIDAARTGRPYVSHWLVARNGREGLTGTGIGATTDAACNGSTSAASGQAQLSFGFSVTNVPGGLDYALLIAQPDGTLVQDVHGSIPEAVFPSPGGSGCYAMTVPAGLVNDQTWPDGTYQVQLLIGPNLDPLGPAASLTVGSATSAPSGGGGT